MAGSQSVPDRFPVIPAPDAGSPLGQYRHTASVDSCDENEHGSDSSGTDGDDDGNEVREYDSGKPISWNFEIKKEDSSKLSRDGIFAPQERKAFIGFCAQYFAVGIIYGGIPATIYGVFLGYLNVPAYVYKTVSVIAMLPWSFKFFFGLLNDVVPIMGLRRKPYMIIGWSLCAVALLILWRTPLPPPYWCIDKETGEYTKEAVGEDGSKKAADPCHPDTAKQGGKYSFLLMMAALGYVIADVAADGLTTQYAKAEPLGRRGSTQTTAYMTRTIGQACSTLFVGFFMNSKMYNGSFDWGLSFETVCFCFAVPAVLMVPVSAIFVKEQRIDLKEDGEKTTCRRYFVMCWELLKSKAFFFTVLYIFLTPVISQIVTTAGPQVKMTWAGVRNFQNQMFSLFGHILFAFGLWLVKKKFLNTDWRLLIGVTMVFLQVVDSFFVTFTIFDVVRNPYFYLGETVLIELPSAANFVVSTFIVVEMADNGNEGLVYGLLTTAGNLGSPFAAALSNQIFGLFQPSLSNGDNYIEDTPGFRWTVFSSFMVSYGFAFLSLSTLRLLPSQKVQAQERKQNWDRRPIYGYITVGMLSMAFVYSLTVNFLSMIPSTMCLKFAGGDGCNNTTDG